MQGRPEPTKFRDERRPGGPASQPLVDHRADVACVLQPLLAQPTIRRRLARADSLEDREEVQRA